MSWHCRMIGTERKCMDWGVYLKLGWDESKSFTVEEYQGVFKEGKKRCVKK